jgi:hypothetical protein
LLLSGLNATTPHGSAYHDLVSAKGQELARDAIDKMDDATASPEERDQRRRRLTKGPPEFCEARVDQPKAKGK